jgi:hypothetical protein
MKSGLSRRHLTTVRRLIPYERAIIHCNPFQRNIRLDGDATHSSHIFNSTRQYTHLKLVPGDASPPPLAPAQHSTGSYPERGFVMVTWNAITEAASRDGAAGRL